MFCSDSAVRLTPILSIQEIAQKLINTGASSDEQGNPINPIDVHFRSLDLESMVPISSESKEFAALAAYARDTHGSTHYYQTTLATAFRVRRSDLVRFFSCSGADKPLVSENMKMRIGLPMDLMSLGTANAFCSGTVLVQLISLVNIQSQMRYLYHD